jgi:hypothetical protein
MKTYLVIDKDYSEDHYIVNDIDELIREMYEDQLDEEGSEVCKRYFYETHKVFIINGEIELSDENLDM